MTISQGALAVLGVLVILAALGGLNVTRPVQSNTKIILPEPEHKEVTAVDATAGGKL